MKTTQQGVTREQIEPQRQAGSGRPDPAGPRKCRAAKAGGVTLHCTEPEGHDRGPDATWHKAEYTEHREVRYDGSHHVADLTERVTWEPADHVAEAVRLLTADRPKG